MHGKFDADTESKAFGKTYSNKLIAEKYSEVVVLRLGVDSAIRRKIADSLAPVAEKLFDKLDQVAQKTNPGTPPATKQP